MRARNFRRAGLKLFMAFAAIGVGCASQASAEFVQAPEGTYRCSAGAGQFLQAEPGRWKRSWSLSGRVRFAKSNATSEWPASGGFVFELEEGGTVGAFLGKSERKPDMLEITIKLPGVGESEWLADVRLDSWANLTVYLDEASNLIVSDGQTVRTVALNNPKVIGRLVHCQSGTFEFDIDPAAPPGPSHSN